MAKETILGSIELTKLKNVFVQNKKSEKTGQIVPCLCIPIELNQIQEFPVKDDKGVIVPDQHSNRFGIEVRILVDDEKNEFGSNGFIAKKLTKEMYEANKDNEKFLKESQPILGNLIKLSQANPNAPAAPIPVVEDDGMPF